MPLPWRELRRGLTAARARAAPRAQAYRRPLKHWRSRCRNGSGLLTDLRVRSVTSWTRTVAYGAVAGVSARKVRAAVNPHPSPGDAGPAPRIVDLFQPVTSSKPAAAPLTDRPVKPLTGRTQDSEPLFAPATLPGHSPATRRWTPRVAGLLSGTQGAIIALLASAVLVLVVTGITLSRNSSSTGSVVAEFAADRPPAPAPPAINDPQPVTGAPVTAPAGFTPHATAKAHAADNSVVSAPAQSPPAAHQPAQPAQQVLPVQPTQQVVPAQPASPASPQAPDQGPVSPPPSSPPPSAATSEGPRHWTVSDSYSENTQPQPTDRESCHCGPDQWGRPSRADQQREYRSPRDGYRATSPAEESRDDQQSRFSEWDRQPDADGGHRTSSERRSADGHGHAPR